MTEYIGAPPAEKVIPVTKGCDRSFTLQRVDADGDPLNFESGHTVYMWIDLATAVKVDATISGASAALTIPDSVCDQVTKATRWRVVLDQGQLEIPLLVGRFERHDG